MPRRLLLMVSVFFAAGPVLAEPPGEPAAAEPDVREPVGAVDFLRTLCEQAKADRHEWVRARVALPLTGVQAINDEPDPMLGSLDISEAEGFKYIRYCRFLPKPGTPMAKHAVTESEVSGEVVFGKVPHRVRFSTATKLPRLTQLQAEIAPTSLPRARKKKPRDYSLGRPPSGFTKNELPGAKTLRRRVTNFLRRDRRCLDAYAARHKSSVRIRFRALPGKRVEVQPYQLVPVSLIGCLKTQFATFKPRVKPATAVIVEMLIPVGAHELEGAAIIEGGSF